MKKVIYLFVLCMVLGLADVGNLRKIKNHRLKTLQYK